MNPDVRVIKKGQCPSTSGKSQLTYEIGVDADDALHFAVTGNNGGGYWSTEWVRLTDIQEALAEKAEDLTSVALFPLFRGKSVNTPAFLLAVLKAEKLVASRKGKQRRYELLDPSEFLARMRPLIDGKPTRTAKKRTAKKKAAAKKAKAG